MESLDFVLEILGVVTYILILMFSEHLDSFLNLLL